MNKDRLKEIVRQEVNMLFEGLTIRQIARELNISKTAVWKHLHEYVEQYCGPITAKAVQSRLDLNFKEKYIRGGQATSKRWQEVKEIYSKRRKEV